jgi:hypothetical protein
MNTKWSYVAGIVDGEGSICIYNKSQTRSYCGEIIIPNTSLNLMKWLTDNFGGRYTVFQPEKLHGFNRKVLYRWRPAGKKNRENFLLGILPYLVIKKKQAQLLLDFERLPKLNRWQEDDGQKPAFVKQMSLLNHGETSVETNTQDISNTLKMCPDCKHLVSQHQPKGYGGCSERVCDAAGDMDYCPCLNTSEMFDMKIESGLTGDSKSAPDVNQGSAKVNYHGIDYLAFSDLA